MDNIDRAAEREEKMREEALAAQAKRAGFSGKHTADSAKFCEGCGETIPEARRRALPGVKLCVECQGYMERVARTGGAA